MPPEHHTLTNSVARQQHAARLASLESSLRNYVVNEWMAGRLTESHADIILGDVRVITATAIAGPDTTPPSLSELGSLERNTAPRDNVSPPWHRSV